MSAYASLAARALLVVLTLLALSGLVGRAIDQLPAAAQTCQEDEACWDCTTMGNRVCGP